MIKAGDKVRINVELVPFRGLPSDEVWEYIQNNPNETYIVENRGGFRDAPFVLKHPVVGLSSFHEEELELVTRDVLLRDQMLKLANAEDSSENYERIAEAVFDSFSSEDESYSHIGNHILQAYLKNDADAMLSAICGWSMKSILAKAGLIPDDEHVFFDDNEDAPNDANDASSSCASARCAKCVFELSCTHKHSTDTCKDYKRDASDGGYYG